MLNKLIFKFGSYLRNDLISQKYKELKESEKLSIKELEEQQFLKLKDFLKFVLKNNEYYKKKFEKFGFEIGSLKSLEDLKKIPILEKEELKKFNSEIQIKKGFKKLFFSETSGSTGEPLIFYRNMEWDAGHRAAIFRGYSWYDVNPWDKNGYLWGYNISKIKSTKVKILDLLQNRERIFSYSKKNIEKFAKKTKKWIILKGIHLLFMKFLKK